MPLALLAGPFGRRDPGEDAVLAALVRALPGWELVVTSSAPELTRAAHGCDAIPDGSRVAVGRAIARADATVLAGGVVNEFARGNAATAALTRVCTMLSATHAMGKPAVLMGIGSGPLTTRRQRTLARATVRQADLLVLRDASSARILAASGAEPPFRVGADPAWSLFEFGAGRAVAHGARNGNGNGNGRREGSPTVVAVLDRDACDEQLTDRLAQAFGSLGSHGIRLRLQPWRAVEGRSDDVRLAGVVAGRIPGAVEIAEPPESLAGAGRAFVGAQLVVVLRQHALMAAAAAGLPAVAVARDAGLVDLARRLRQPAVTASAPPERIADVIRLSLERPAASRSAVQGQVSSAEEGFRLLRLLVSGGRSEDANDLTGLPLEPAASA